MRTNWILFVCWLAGAAATCAVGFALIGVDAPAWITATISPTVGVAAFAVAVGFTFILEIGFATPPLGATGGRTRK